MTRWCQGDINIVVNTEKEGFAHSYNITHGTAVCTLGLRVDDAAAALDRAQLLLDMPFRQAVGPGELEIPAVRGLGGSLIYFIDPKTDLGRVWDIEFRAVADGSSKGDAGLQTGQGELVEQRRLNRLNARRGSLIRTSGLPNIGTPTMATSACTTFV